MNNLHGRTFRTHAARHGFTLTEMLVATALVLMILLIFAQIYGAATGTMITQRGIAQNDGRARIASTILRSDLKKMSYGQASWATNPQPAAVGSNLNNAIVRSEPQGIVPLRSGDVVDAAQLGFLYIAENDLGNDSDDILHFTTFIEEVGRDHDLQPYRGKASRIGRPEDPDTTNVDSSGDNGLFRARDLNQPVYDDGDSANGASQSRAAEIVYFVRNGILYRRVLLLRDPLPDRVGHTADPTMSWTDPSNDPDRLGQRLFPNGIPYGGVAPSLSDLTPQGPPNQTGDFWNDFDYAAIFESGAGGHLHFHSIASLNNALGTENDPIALPQHRFGFGLVTRRPREYLDPGNSNPALRQFIGRFTHQETSSHRNTSVTPNTALFSYPGSPVNNPVEQPASRLQLNRYGVVESTIPNNTGIFSGPRAGEDILLTNVDAFDIKVWDENANSGNGGFVDIGHNQGSGYFRANQDRNDTYGSRASGNNVFDTWHPNASVAGDADPPYRPLQQNPGAVSPWQASTVGPDGLPGTSDDALQPYSVGNMIKPSGGTNGSILYRAVRAVDRNGDSVTSSGYLEPIWPTLPGAQVQDGEITWQAFDNRIGLKMIQITIRYRDRGSDLPRDLTIVHSFVP